MKTKKKKIGIIIEALNTENIAHFVYWQEMRIRREKLKTQSNQI